MKILVTGASGFIGKQLVKELVKNNKVDCLVRKTSNIGDLRKLKNIKFYYGDVTDLESLKKIKKNYDVIYHLVGIGGLTATSEEKYKMYMNVNAEGTRNLLESFKDMDIKKVIIFSSTAAVGVFNGIKNEESECVPESHYQKSKYQQEKISLEYYKKYNLPIIILRPSMVCGFGDTSELTTICKFIKKGFVPIFGNGRNKIPIVHVNDVVQATILLEKKGKIGETYIVTNREAVPFEVLVKKLSKILNKKVVIIKIPKVVAKFFAFFIGSFFKIIKKDPFITMKRVDSVASSREFNISKLECLGYKQKIKLDDCLEDSMGGRK